MIGTRLPDDDGQGDIPIAGAYWLNLQGDWMAMTPNGLLAGLRNHTVVEHEDRTISVVPSILVTRPYPSAADELPPDLRWHGFLECGIWRQVD